MKIHKSILTVFLFILLAAQLTAPAQSVMVETKSTDSLSHIYLVNSARPQKKIKLSPKGEYELSYNEPVTDTFTEYKSFNMTGFIANMNQNSLHFELSSETINLQMVNGMQSWINNDYYSNVKTIRKVELENINYIYYRNNATASIGTTGVVTTVLSLITTLIAAPLVSTNFKNGDFNKNRYYTVAGAGLIGLALGIPLTAIGSKREFEMTTKDIKQGKHYWYLQSQTRR